MSDSDAREWARLASHDAETAALLQNERGYPEIIIYHAHQAVDCRH